MVKEYRMSKPRLTFLNNSKQPYPAWSMSLLKDAVEINPKTESMPNKFVYIDLEAVQRGALISTKIYEKQDAPSRAQRLLKANDVLFQMVRPYQKNNYIFELEGSLPTVSSTGYAQLRTKENCPKFIYYTLHTEKFVRNVLDRCTGGTYPAINSSDLGEIAINIPCKEEQQKIAAFFTTLDEKILLIDKTIASLNNLKHGLMDCLFKRRVRFNGKDGTTFGKWRLSTIGAEGTFYYGKSAPKWSLSDTATTPCIRYGDLYTKHEYVVKAVDTYTEIEREKLVFSKGGEVLVPRVGEDPLDFCKCAYLPMKNIAIGEMISVYETDNDGLYISYYFNSQMKKTFAKYVEGGNVSNLYYTYLEGIELEVPTIDEQMKISDFLSVLIEKIDVNKNKKENYIRLKRAFMQKMFV